MFSNLVITVVSASVSLDSLISVSGDAETCVTARALREEVMARLGTDAFEAKATFAVQVVKGPPVRLELRILNGPARTFSSRDCSEVLESAALAMAVALDPRVLLSPAPPARAPEPAAAAAPAPTPAPPPVTVVAPPAPIPPTASARFSGGLMAGAAGGLSARITPTLGAVLGVRWSPWTFRIEGRVELPTTVELPLNRVRSFALLATLTAGWQGRWLRAGVALTAGALSIDGDQGAFTTRRSQPVALVGPELAIRLVAASWLSFELTVRLQAALTRVTVLSGTETAWATWPVGVVVGVGALAGTDEAERE